ncbi:helix-turn-helix domain-containing protein [Leifsonia sp. NPDC080035]|uniref:Helix-turn-helix domain-containing protein n=1 Tax=Leifsonia sp. NPDC080035 TaxID=3143936 RepID=A0AAU7GGK2_9MICO
MVKRVTHVESACGIARSVDIIGDGWSLLIVRDALEGARRFLDFQRASGVSKTILSTRLRHLVDAGVMRIDERDGHHNEYELTDKGRDLFTVLVALRQWANIYTFDPEEERAEYIDTVAGDPLAAIVIRAADGRAIGPADATVARP